MILFCKPHIKRRVATVFVEYNCLIENYLRARRENLPRKIDPLQAFCRSPLLEYGCFKPILPFLEGRSDAACRVVIRLHAFHLWSPYGFSNDAARCVATVFEIWNFLIETYLRIRRKNFPPQKNLNPYGPFAADSLWNAAVSNLFSRFSEDVATRRAASLSPHPPFLLIPAWA